MSEFFDDASRTPKVLVVEDEDRFRQFLLSAIPDMGFEASGARSAEEAMRVMEQEPRRILILDLNLPGEGGLEFFQKAREKWPEIEVIILTGFGDLDTAKEAIHLDVVEFLTKPCTLGDLEKALDRARHRIDHPRGDRPLPRLPDLESDEAEESEKPTPPPLTEEQEKHVKTLQEIERETILAALNRNEGNRQATAKELGISVRTLYYRLSEYESQGYLDR